jgi:oxepin-CoA hydrolase/3-oxo-5,6-dehydrosuberyl-CoA semialdehyde dehydrogenase
MIELASYVCGHWVYGKGDAATLLNPATEVPLATASTTGIDFGAAVAFAGERGGPALRAMTFRDRGELLRAMSRAIHDKRDELLAIAVANGGNTRSDAKFDVDGAIGTLAAYADLAQYLGDGRLLADGEGMQLGRSPRMFGQHVYVPRQGVAVHVNAFNFPAWGLAEKTACALLAGMPVIVKPATSTAMLVWRIVQIVVEEKLVPHGAISLACGSIGDLLDRLGGQDVLAFTGSGATAAKVRACRAFTQASAHVNVEADSLNAAVLGPDVEDGSDLCHLFVADVVRDVSQKAGQKCTAIRRVYVPAPVVGAVLERLRERLLSIQVGDPVRADVTMGPVTTAQQLRDVGGGIATLATCGDVVCGGPDRVDGLGVDAKKGYFVAPTLIHARDPRPGDAVHVREVFGPVVTVMPYDGSAAAAAERVGWGGGGLVSSVYSDDRSFVRDAVLGIAHLHGRISIGSSKIASQSLPPGTVLPQLLHGGPGRAGGGEELGGRRGLSLYMQRVALQGDRAIVEAMLAESGLKKV